MNKHTMSPREIIIYIYICKGTRDSIIYRSKKITDSCINNVVCVILKGVTHEVGGMHEETYMLIQLLCYCVSNKAFFLIKSNEAYANARLFFFLQMEEYLY